MKLKTIGLLLATSSLLFANTNYSRAYTVCMDNSGGVTSNMLMCNADELKRHDALLNQNYKKAMSVLSQEKKTELKQVQREWMKYRDIKCGFEGSLTGGSMDRIIGSECVLNMTAVRAQELGNISTIF